MAAIALYLRDSKYMGDITYAQIKQWAGAATSFDPNGYRAKHVAPDTHHQGRLLDTLQHFLGPFGPAPRQVMGVQGLGQGPVAISIETPG